MTGYRSATPPFDEAVLRALLDQVAPPSSLDIRWRARVGGVGERGPLPDDVPPGAGSVSHRMVWVRQRPGGDG